MKKKKEKKKTETLKPEESQEKEVKSPSLAEQSSENNANESKSESTSPESETTENKKASDQDKPKEKSVQDEPKSEEKTDNQEKAEVESKTNKNEDEVIEKTDDNGDGDVSSREMINAIDPENSTNEPSDDEIIARKIGRQIEEKEKYFSFRVKKSSFLLITGAIVMGLWLIPVSSFLSNRYGLSISSLFSKKEAAQQEIAPSPEPNTETKEASKSAIIDLIRIKTLEETDTVKNMQTLLKNSGYDAEILIADDIEDKGVTVAAKQDQVGLLIKLLALLKEDYFAASSSSQVTSDSDFSAVVMVGK